MAYVVGVVHQCLRLKLVAGYREQDDKVVSMLEEISNE